MVEGTSECKGVRFAHPHTWAGTWWGNECLAVVEQARSDGGFRANLVLTVTSNGGLSFRDWQSRTDQFLPRMLTNYSLVDIERLSVAGRPGGRRCARYLAPSGALVLTHQWFTSAGDLGVTLSGTADIFSFAALRTVFAHAAATLTIPSSRFPTT